MNRRFSVLGIALLLFACSEGPAESRLLDYQQRLQRTLQLKLPEPSAIRLHRMPQPRVLQAPKAHQTIDLLDLWSLRDCALQTVIAEKNSSLGRVAQSSTRLFHELDFLRLYPDCLATLRTSGKNELAAVLLEVAEIKRQFLPVIIWQAVLGGQENRDYWDLPQQVGDYAAAAGKPSRDSLQALTRHSRRWLGGDYQVDRSAVELHLQKLRHGSAGTLYKSLVMQSHYLGALDTAIGLRLQAGPVCLQLGGPPAPILDNVVRQFFVGKLQPWSVQLQTGVLELGPMRALENLLISGEPEAFASWRSQRDAQLEHALGAPRRHVESLLPALEQCGLAPGQAAAN